MKPYYQDNSVTIFHGDCREILLTFGSIERTSCGLVDVAIVDPPYGETSLAWDVPVNDWVNRLWSDTFWCFGSMRMFMSTQFDGWKFAQDIVWEKQNGSSFHADRFKRVHEHVCQFYRGEWEAIYKNPVTTPDATARTVRRKRRPPHTGHIEAGAYVSHDGGPRLMTSVFHVSNCHGYAEHPTQKPIEVVIPLIEYSCPLAGVILDPFMGSGTTLRAAKDLGRKAIGIEIEEKYCEIAAHRMGQEVLDFANGERCS